MRDGFSVSVAKWGNVILTIEPNMLAGGDLSEEDADAIRDAAEHLLSFVGPPSEPPQCLYCYDDPDACNCAK